MHCFVSVNIYGLKVKITLLRLYSTCILKLPNKNICHNLNLGLATKARVYKVASQKEAESHTTYSWEGEKV